MRTRSEIPEQFKWKLEDIYQNEAQWEEEYHELEGMLPALEARRQSIAQSAGELKAGLDEMYRAMLLLERLYVYARMRRDEDNANSYYQGLADRAQGLNVKLSAAISYLNPLLLSLPEGVLEGYAAQSELADYRFMLEDLLRSKAHVLGEGEERLLSMAGDFSDGAQGIYTMLNNADLSFGSVEHDGQTHQLTHATYIGLMQSEDRALREKVFHQFYRSFQSHINTITATYGTSVKKDVFYAKARKYQSALDAALSSDNVPQSVYRDLIDTVHAHLPTMYRYVALRKKILGIQQLEMYDIYAPLVSEVNAK
ncbi:MAG: oligoendopeptidase F, partial [Clostridiales bacterium]|nr:oligoendopeptidase F [Clostridiales bacterium]